jgi:DNA-directed RNA polymerase specialized sigma24 family protein
MAATTIEIPIGQLKTDLSTSRQQRQSEQFDQWFYQCRNTPHFMAGLIVGDSKMAEDAVQNCWIKASRNPPSIESEGPFRSWIMRRLISEALSILHQSHTEASEENVPAFRKK